MRTLHTSLLAALCWYVIPVGAGAQVQVQVQRLQPATPATDTVEELQAVVDDTAPQQAPAAQDAAQAKKQAAMAAQASAEAQQQSQRKQQHLQKIGQLNFDRRPSAILKAWSAVNEKPTEPSGATPGSASQQSTPAKASTTSPADPFDDDIKVFQRDVTLGNWEPVKHYLIDLPADEGKALYARLLQSLQGAAQVIPPDLPAEVRAQMARVQAMQRQQRRPMEEHSFSLDDVVALAYVAPVELDDNSVSSLGIILREALQRGNVMKECLQRFNDELAKPKDEAAVDRRQAAKIFFAADRPIEAGEFLPTVESATEDDDFEALNLLSRYYLALHTKEKKTEHLEFAWKVTQSVLASIEAMESARRPAAEPDKRKERMAQKQQALARAVDLAPRIREELGQAWLEESFTGRPERGMEILASIGAVAAQGIQQQPMNPDVRLKSLQLQTTAVEALLKSSPARAAAWLETLDLLAANWLGEATISYQFDQSTRRGPSLQRDQFGNFFYSDAMFRNASRQQNRVRPITTGDLLEIRPGKTWLSYVSESLKPRFDMIFAQLLLKVNEEDNAFPYIESLAAVYPGMAKDLVDEFLRVWTTNHDPNASRNRTNYYMFMYGYERKAESIPLTRSKQQRNLKELAVLVKRLRALPLEDLNEQLLARAFTTCHSSAEVYRLHAIEEVFGSLDSLEPKTLAEMAQQMRANLIGVWRQPAVQKDKNTKRKQKDIQAEVLRGYAVARSVIEGGLRKHPDDWALQLAAASLDHDENNYRKEIAPDSTFSARRDDSFAGFEKAARLYADQVGDLAEEKQTTRVYELWYYASLGACDLQHVTEEMVPDLRQPQRIRQAILDLPGEAAERHVAMFANTLFTRMSAAKPAVKFRYVRTGLEIVGDHKQAAEARKVYDYYKDLITEIKLETVIDGSNVVGHKKPFGVFVNLRHTREIERESGGFGRYLQNQNSNNYYYNYGRPLENYRDKFEEIVTQALEEHFEILSVTFQKEDVHSKATGDYGWRVTPYAYLLLQARGPEVDKIPPVRLDLDFLDTSGYAVIPIESPTLPIDASPESGEARPLAKLQITQTLDERQADQGKLILEIKATAQGLVPDLDQLVELAPKEFDIVEAEDQGVSVSQFDPESDATVVDSERTWMVTMQAKADLPERPKTFEFAKPVLDVDEVLYQRYDDADLAQVEQIISLEQEYGQTNFAWTWPVAGVLLALAGIGIVIVLARRRPQQSEQAVLRLPENITPFTVLGLLRHIEANNGFSDDARTELRASIDRLERHYFETQHSEEPDLKQIAEAWIQHSVSRAAG